LARGVNWHSHNCKYEPLQNQKKKNIQYIWQGHY
jgi:hypothetical protein